MGLRGRDIRAMRELKGIRQYVLRRAIRKSAKWLCDVEGEKVPLEPEVAELLIVTINDIHRARQRDEVAV